MTIDMYHDLSLSVIAFALRHSHVRFRTQHIPRYSAISKHAAEIYCLSFE